MQENNSEVKENILSYILGGKACFCIRQAVNGVAPIERWFRVNVNENGSTGFVYAKEGIDYKYAGYFKISEIKCLDRMSQGKKKIETSSPDIVKPLLRVIRRLSSGSALWEGVSIYHDGRCPVCGRRLTDYESIRRGIGPVCFERLKKKFPNFEV